MTRLSAAAATFKKEETLEGIGADEESCGTN